MNKVINSFCNTGENIKSEICGGVSDFIFLYVEKIKSEICGAVSAFIFLYVEKIKSEICGAASDFIFLYVEKIKSEIFVPFGHRSLQSRFYTFWISLFY